MWAGGCLGGRRIDSATVTGYHCALNVLLQNLLKNNPKPQKGTGTEQEDLLGFV